MQICQPSTTAGVAMSRWTQLQPLLKPLMISNMTRVKMRLPELDLYKEGDDTRFDYVLGFFFIAGY